MKSMDLNNKIMKFKIYLRRKILKLWDFLIWKKLKH